MKKNKSGQVLVGVIMIMVVLSIIIPAMVMYVQNEAKWAVKQKRNMAAFQLAEAAVDRGYRKITESTSTWYAAQDSGTIPSGYNFDVTYDDLEGGTYTIAMSTGPDPERIRIYGIGRDSAKKEIRAVRARYANLPMTDTAILGGGGVTIADSAKAVVHWGAIVSPNDIAVDGRTFPQLWTNGNVDLDTTIPSSTPPNCDQDECCQWHSYADIPPDPGIDPEYFKTEAQKTGTYFPGNVTWGVGDACYDDTDCDTGNYYFIDGDLAVTHRFYVRGALAIAGDLSLPKGNIGAKSGLVIDIPDTAWMHYCKDWDVYRLGEDDAPGGDIWDESVTLPVTWPGITAKYTPNPVQTAELDKVMINGFIYIGGNFTQEGGAGGNVIVGAMYTAGTVDIGANTIEIYYNKASGSFIRTTQIFLTRESWRDLPGYQWPIP